MKKIKKMLFVIFMFLPIVIFASTYSKGTNIAKTYYNSFNKANIYFLLGNQKYE